jgi:hypothetical protein
MVTYTVTRTRCSIDTIDSLDDGHEVARNMLRIEINKEKKELCIKLVIYRNLMVLGQDCRVDMATLYSQNLWIVSVVCTHMYGLLFYGGETLETYFLWSKLVRGKRLDVK